MTRDESIELAAFLGLNLSAGYIVSFGKVGRDTDCCVEVSYVERLVCDTHILNEVALERRLLLDWHDRHGEQVATFRSVPSRSSFADLSQAELDTCFEVVFGADELAEARQHGGVRTVWNQCLSTGLLSSQLLGRVNSCELMLSVGSDRAVQVWADMGDRILAGPPVNLFAFVEHMKVINLDFNF